MEFGKLLIIFTILATFLFNSSIPVIAQEVEDEKEFSYEKDSEVGPEHWGRIHKEWETCGKGQLQSPIDLSDKRVQVLDNLGDIRHNYKPSNAIMKNRGHDIMNGKMGAGEMWLNGTEYILKQLHWHSPSEHTINGHEYDMELHMVHESKDKKIAVVGTLYRIGQPDSFLTKMEDYLEELAGEKGEEVKIGKVNPREVNKGSRKYYRYMGSLTTPPCTEGVVWTIVDKTRTVSKHQLNLLREAVHDETETNARPTQPDNDRAIYFYNPRKLQN
ncbi:alpha carbonic anhydrase 7-like [Dioscorea cayenensis subsp. rotundata]|uniref:Carbonic anhydrase n=1 Tax=Dioscorea cayennensis subsp. rotundata TaxID=55577 RepID=A0AB40BHT6_DIOCR|nr:alpha carbonic anhydrase 7-like [Dioscorea cayenensis subsp. rotundata]